MAAGIAMKEGLISLDEPIYHCFESEFPEKASEYLYQITVRHLLTMGTGQNKALFFCDDKERYQIKDWLKYYFRHGEFIHPPGSRYLYSNLCAYTLSCMIEMRSKEGLLDYLRYRLFEPLGIGNPDWTFCPKGHCMAVNGLYLTIEELARFGQMLLNEGEYQGKQIVPKEYVREACSRQIDSYDPNAERAEYQSYGYGYYINMAPIPDACIAVGNYGQCCFVIPGLNSVLCVMALDGNDHKKIRDDLVDAVSEYYHIPIMKSH